MAKPDILDDASSVGDGISLSPKAGGSPVDDGRTATVRQKRECPGGWAWVPLAGLVAAALVFGGPVLAAESPVVRAGSELDFRPYGFTDKDGQPTGFGPELLRSVADRMGLRLQRTVGPWDTVWNDLVAGNLDVLSIVARTPGREPLVDFSLPHTETFDAFFVRSGQPVIANLTAASGKEIVVSREDAAHHQLVERKFAGKIIAVGSIPEGLRLVAAGKHDAFLCSKVIGMLELKAARIAGVAAGPPIPDYKRTFCFGVRKGQAELVEKLNQGLLIIKSDGTYDRIYRKWLDTHEPRYPYLRWFRSAAAVAGGLAIAVLVLQGLVRRRTRQLRELNAALEARVAERSAALRELADAMPQLVWTANAEGIPDYYNARAVEYGVAATSLTSKDWTPALHPDDVAPTLEAWREAVARGLKYEKEQRLRVADGSYRWHLARAVPQRDPNGVIIKWFGTTTDIHELKHAEEVLVEQARLLDLSRDAIIVRDAGDRVTYWNEGAEELYGYERQEALGRIVDELLKTEFPNSLEDIYEIMRREKRWEGELIHTRKDGSRVTTLSRWVPDWDSQGRLRATLETNNDISGRKEAEAALRQSEERLRFSLESCQIGAWDIDLEDHTAYRSLEHDRIFGYQELLASWTLEDFLKHALPEYREPVEKMVREATAAKTGWSYECQIRRVDGEVRWIWFSGQHRVDSSGRSRVAGVVQDITERKRAEEKLREQQRLHKSVTDNATLALFIMDDRQHCVFMNPAAVQLTGYTLEETQGRPLHDVVHHTRPDGRPYPLSECAIDRAFPENDREQGEEVFVHKDGHFYPVAFTASPLRTASGEPVGTIVEVQDTTERKRAEEALREREERLRTLADNLPESAVYQYLRRTGEAVGRFTFWSAGIEKLTGLRVEDALADAGRLYRLIPPEHLGRLTEEEARCMRELRDFDVEVPMRRTDGELRWMRLRSRPRELADGSVVWDGVQTDITERRRAEAELAKYREELERLVAERTAKLHELVGELEHFSYTITHDLKSPLRAMRGFAEIAGQVCGEGEAKPFLDKISAAAERMDGLIADALSYSRSVRQELPLGDVDAGALLRGILDSYPQFQPWKAQIRVEEPLPVVLANEAGLTQVFSNLLGNAVKFVKPGEKPVVRVWASEVQGHGRDPEWVRIWVEDKGIGIAKEMLPRVFDMFARGSKDYEGTGIGLALVRKVVQRMGGKVGVESEEGEGSRFWIELGRGEARVVLTQGTGQPPAGAGEGMVLYVEDEESDALFMERAFAERGLGEKLRRVGTGRAAIDYLSGSGDFADREKYPVPSVVLLDLNLPQVSGFGVLEWIRNHPDYARLPVVIFSSSTREDDRVKARELGANEFVAKPSSGLEFGEVVEGLRGKWMGGRRG